MTTALPALTMSAASGSTLTMSVRVLIAATARATRHLMRSPALPISPLAQSLFFLLVYAGQLGNVGSSYLTGTSFIAFLLPLILLTGVATGAGSAGTLVLKDQESGYLDRLRLAHGSTTPFIAGAVLAALFAVIFQIAVTIAGAFLMGYRASSVSGLLLMIGLLVVLGAGIALLTAAIAIRTKSSASTGLIPLVVFGLSFFTGVFAPVDNLVGWMKVVATGNPLTYIINSARTLESTGSITGLPLALGILIGLVAAGALACVLALAHTRRTR